MEYDIIIIGTTIDRITSAIYALKLGKKVLLIESNELREYALSFENIKDYSLKKYVNLDRFRDQLIDYGGSIKDEEIIEIKNNEVITNKGIYKAKAIVIATGARQRLLGLKDEEKFLDDGIHFCIKCDAPFYKDEIGCVVGDDGNALKNALVLSDICKNVVVLCEKERFNEVDLLNTIYSKNNIEVYYNTKITKIVGNNELEKIILSNDEEIDVDCIFLSNGFVPNIEKINIKNKNKGIFIIDSMENIKGETGVSVTTEVINYIDNLK